MSDARRNPPSGRRWRTSKGELRCANPPPRYSYGINGLGQRVAKTSTALSTGGRRYAYDEAGRLLGEYDRTGARVQEHVYLGEMPVAVIGSGGGVYYVHSDHLGTPRQILSTTQQLRWRWDLADPFGANAPNANPQGLGSFAYNLRLPGQYFDAESGLHYNTHRDYDPRLGRYIESDPIGLAGGVNTYAYVGGNPVGFVDPSGLLFEWMGGPWTGFGSDISTPGNFGAAAAGAATGYGLGSGLTALARIGKAVDAALPNCPVAAKQGVQNKFPGNWTSKPNKKGVGTRWQDPNNPGNGVRIDQGNPNHSLPSQQVDHVVVRLNGRVIGQDGIPINGSVAENAENAHIPLSEYENWSTWHSP
jgi:RHS repeat-associated protein